MEWVRLGLGLSAGEGQVARQRSRRVLGSQRCGRGLQAQRKLGGLSPLPGPPGWEQGGRGRGGRHSTQQAPPARSLSCLPTATGLPSFSKCLCIS